jgi:hypothetical protein
MHFEVKYSSGQTYEETIKAGTARVRQRSNRVMAWFKGPGKSVGTFSIAKEDAARLAHALLLASSTEDTLVEFPFGEVAKT